VVWCDEMVCFFLVLFCSGKVLGNGIVRDRWTGHEKSNDDHGNHEDFGFDLYCLFPSISSAVLELASLPVSKWLSWRLSPINT
jgi:hypothetical protein